MNPDINHIDAMNSILANNVLRYAAMSDTATDDRLEDINRLFEILKCQSISFCIWKSNEHLVDALCGQTDIDVLIDPSKRDEAEQVFRRLRLIRLVPQSWAAYDDVDDWIGYDTGSGRLYHLHVHYALRVGSKSLKNLRLPLESWALCDAELLHGVRVIRAEKELVLLIIRHLVRNVAALGRLRQGLLRRGMQLPESFCCEMDWLIARSDREQLVRVIEDVRLGISVSDVMRIYESYVEGVPSYQEWVAIAGRFRSALRQYRREAGVRYVWNKTKRYLDYVFFGVIAGKCGKQRKKRLLNDRMFIALVGADGSGKTTLANALQRWLGWKMDVRRLYFGIPKTSPMFDCVNGMNRLLNHVGRAPSVMKSSLLKRAVQTLNGCVEGAKWCYLARRRLMMSRKAKRLSRDGCVVLAERYPLKQLWNMRIPMDGPRICAQQGGVVGLLSRAEHKYYEQIGIPEVIYALDADVPTLMKRKQDMPQSLLEDRVVAIRRLGACGGVVVVDAHRDYDAVLHDLKSHIWDALQLPLETVQSC